MTSMSYNRAHHDEYLRRHRPIPRMPRVRQELAERKAR